MHTLDPRETRVRSPSPHLFLRPLGPADAVTPPANVLRRVILSPWGGTVAGRCPELIQGRTAINRSERDSLCTTASPAWLGDRFPNVHDKTVPRATHLMHWDGNRYVHHQETDAFMTAAKD